MVQAKAKLVSKGFKQRESIDLCDSFSPTPTKSCFHLLSNVACESPSTSIQEHTILSVHKIRDSGLGHLRTNSPVSTTGVGSLKQFIVLFLSCLPDRP